MQPTPSAFATLRRPSADVPGQLGALHKCRETTANASNLLKEMVDKGKTVSSEEADIAEFQRTLQLVQITLNQILSAKLFFDSDLLQMLQTAVQDYVVLLTQLNSTGATLVHRFLHTARLRRKLEEANVRVQGCLERLKESIWKEPELGEQPAGTHTPPHTATSLASSSNSNSNNSVLPARTSVRLGSAAAAQSRKGSKEDEVLPEVIADAEGRYLWNGLFGLEVRATFKPP